MIEYPEIFSSVTLDFLDSYGAKTPGRTAS
jgi:hypothetical protein